MIIYLIIGNTRQYEDYHEWAVKCFTDKQIAEKYLDLCQNYANNPPLDTNGNIYYTDEWIKDSPDSFFDIDYTGTDYSIIERELITNDFMEQVLLTKRTN